MFGYEMEIKATAEFGRYDETQYKIGYLEDGIVYIALDCYDYIIDKFNDNYSKILLEALCVLIIEFNICIKPDIRSIIDRIDMMLEHSIDPIHNGLSELVNELYTVCDSREYIIPKEYF